MSFMDGDQHPNRPDTRDFWRLSDIMLELDGRIQENDSTIEDEIDKEADTATITYMADQQALRCMEAIKLLAPTSLPAPFNEAIVSSMMTAMWISGFIAGSRFEKRGGKQ